MIDELKIMNPQALTSIFGNIPNLDGSELLDVQIKIDGATLVLILMTKEPVKTKPKRWGNWDVIYIEISFIGVRRLRINGWGTENKITKFDINSKESEGILDILCDNQTTIECDFDWARIERITPGLIGSF